MGDDLGDRMKRQYENRTRSFLPRRTYSIIRIDGKAFHTLTRGFDKPFDGDLVNLMDQTALKLCCEIQGAKLAYVQSDEISILLTDFEKPMTDSWFDGNIQKITSVSASIATSAFNNTVFDLAHSRGTVIVGDDPFEKLYNNNVLKSALFDSRVFTIPDPTEVENYFIWRQQDASRNSVQMVARSLYSHQECLNKNNAQLQDMIHDKGQNWNDYPIGQRRGRCMTNSITGWEIDYSIPIFTQDREYLSSKIPKYGESNE